MAQEPPWNPDDTGAVPVGPEPEPTGSGGGGAGPGGWGPEPRTEPFALAAVVWAVVSIVIPLIGTIVAFVLAGRAADSIRRSQGTRKGEQLVLAARVIAGVVIALWAIGGILFIALRSGDTNDKNNVAIPTQPSVSTTVPPPTSTTKPPVTTLPITTLAPVTTVPVAPSTSIVPPPPTTVAPTNPPTTAPPTTAPPTTTSPDQKQAAILEEKMLANPALGPSNRGVPDNQRFVVQYTAGQPLVVTWAINNGTAPLPSGPPTCVPPTTTTSPTSTSSVSTTTSTTTTTTTLVPPPTTTLPTMSTKDQARADAKQILRTIRTRRNDINITDIVLVGTYPMSGNATAEVVKVTYDKAILNAPVSFPPATAFQVPPAQTLDCINPAFQ